MHFCIIKLLQTSIWFCFVLNSVGFFSLYTKLFIIVILICDIQLSRSSSYFMNTTYLIQLKYYINLLTTRNLNGSLVSSSKFHVTNLELCMYFLIHMCFNTWDTYTHFLISLNFTNVAKSFQAVSCLQNLLWFT